MFIAMNRFRVSRSTSTIRNSKASRSAKPSGGARPPSVFPYLVSGILARPAPTASSPRVAQRRRGRLFSPRK